MYVMGRLINWMDIVIVVYDNISFLLSIVGVDVPMTTYVYGLHQGRREITVKIQAFKGCLHNATARWDLNPRP